VLKRISLFVLISVLLCFTLIGCEAVEVDDDIYPVVIGLDKGVHNKLIVTIEYPTYRGGESGGQSGGAQKKGEGGDSGEEGAYQVPGANIHSIETPTILEGLDIFNMAISRRISLVHIKLLVISEELAREGVGDYLDGMARYRGFRTTMFVLVTNGKAADFIKENKSNIGESLTKSIELMEEQSKKTGFFPDVNFHEFYKDAISPYSAPYAAYVGVNDFKKLTMEDKGGKPKLVTEQDFLPGDLPRIGVAKREYVGTAVFDGDRMVGSLNPTETRYMLMLNGKLKKVVFTIEDKNKTGKGIITDISLGKSPSIKARFENSTPVFDIQLNIEANIEAIQSRSDYSGLSMIDDLNIQIKSYLEDNIKKTIEKVQKELKCDVFGLGNKLAGNFTTIQEWENYNWLSHFPEAKINVDTRVNIRGIGLKLKSSPFFTNEGKK
jgi:germination protein, Ger(x)C family